MLSALRSRWRVIAATAVVTCVVTAWGTLALVRWQTNSAPPAPEIPTPRTIKIALCPMHDVYPDGTAPIDIPPAEFDRVMRFITPRHYYGTTHIHEWILPLVAVVVITHDGLPDTHLLIRSGGKNPALISAGTRYYYYCDWHPGMGDGAMQLRALVSEIAARQSARRHGG
jgi:hypothetical protein